MTKSAACSLMAVAALALLGPAAARVIGDKTAAGTFTAERPLSAEDKAHLRGDKFVVVRAIRGIPAPVLKLLIGDKKDPSDGMADPGQKYQESDALGMRPRPPFRRLILAAVNPHDCLVYFEQGGYHYFRQVTWFRLKNGRATETWRAICYRGDCYPNQDFLTFSRLRVALSTDKDLRLYPRAGR